MRRPIIRPAALRLWLSAIDPGLIRMHNAGRAALAVLSIWLVLRTLLILLYGKSNPTIPLFGVQAGIVLLLFIIDLKPSDRKLSLGLAVIPFIGAVIVASLLADYFWLYSLLLLVLFFFSYALRRYGVRAGELALVTTVGYYLGLLFDPTPAVYPMLLACVFVSALMVYIWQFIIMPYNPVKFLYRSVRAFYHNAAQGVAAIRQGLDSEDAYIPNPQVLQRHYKQVHRNRGVIEGLFSAAVSPGGWSQPRLNRLQEELFKTERGLELLFEAAGKLSDQFEELPDGILQTLKEGLAMLEENLWAVTSRKDQTRLSEAGNWLEVQVKGILKETPTGEWLIALQRIGLAGRQLAQSAAEIHSIETSWREDELYTPLVKLDRALRQEVNHDPGKKLRLTLHPITILGLQAVLATSLAMLAAYLLKMDSPNLVFWTAFVVIAGSTGESLRRITMRVIGVIAGTLIGVALAISIPNNLVLLVSVITMCVFMTIYVLTISYTWMVFFINIATLLIITTMGAPALQMLAIRISSTLLGAAIAGLVVSFVLPIRVHNRFVTALSEYMKVVDRYIENWVVKMVDTSASVDLEVEELGIDECYKKLELTLPSVIYEYNPLTRSQNRLASQGTSLAVLNIYVNNLKENAGLDQDNSMGSIQVDLVRRFQQGIHANMETIIENLDQGLGDGKKPVIGSMRRRIPEISLEMISTSEVGSIEWLRKQVFYHLGRIHDTILQIGTGLGIPVVKDE